ncbi:MAG: amino acid adenylation domain-containing protein, partial [Ginsengibacter sp.]
MRETILPLHSLLSITEQEKLQRFERSACEYPKEKNIITLFEEKVLEVSKEIAIAFDGIEINYAEVNERANRVGHFLKQKGVTTGSLVPLCMERSAEMIIAILGILKVGGAYVPIDPDFPTDRIAYILQDTAAQIIITDANSLRSLPQDIKIEVLNCLECTTSKQQSIVNLNRSILPGDLAYVIYTSGSTGTPKGVMIEHNSLLDHCFGLIESASLDTCKSFALFSPLIFDAGHALIHTSFILGSCIHVLSKTTLADGDKLYQYINGNKIDCIKIVPSLWMSYADENNILLPGKVMIFGGEAFPLSIFNRLKSKVYQGKVFNHYGPTEATIGKTIHEVDFSKQYATIPIGKPFSNTQIYILNKDGKRTLMGEPGEIHIAGDGLAREYLNQASLTAQKFISDTVSKVAGKRMYKTGDLAKWLPDGNIEYLGRIDDQVKINGYRIEPGEIESAIEKSGMVIQTIIISLPGKNGNQQLVGYIIIQPGFSIDHIKDYLQKHLPGYMIPAQWVLLQHFPLTISGKIDRKNLPKPGEEITKNNHYTVAPRNTTEVKLVALWMNLLHLDDVSTRDNFFKLGGQSLVAMRLATAIRKQLKIKVTVKDIFNYNTIETLASYIDQQVEVNPTPVISASARPLKIPLSFNQQSLWFIHQLNGSRQYHLPTIIQINGDLNISALGKAFQQLVNRHEALRTIIDIDNENGDGHQFIKDAAEWRLEVKDAASLNWTSARVKTFISEFISSPFDLADDFMLRATVIREKTDQYILAMVIHHIASDRWSNNILLRELSNLYNSDICGINADLTQLTLQYADYSIWQREHFVGANVDKDRAYWKEKLDNISTLNLPLDFPRPVNHNIEGGVWRNSLDKKLKDKLHILATINDASLFITLLAAFKVLLYKYCGQNDICIGTPVSGRQYEGLEAIVGYFVNTLVLRSQVQGNDTFNDLLKQVKEVALEAYNHQGMPFEKLVESVGVERDNSRGPLFQVMFVFQEIAIGKQLNLDKLKTKKLRDDDYGYST